MVAQFIRLLREQSHQEKKTPKECNFDMRFFAMKNDLPTGSSHCLKIAKMSHYVKNFKIKLYSENSNVMTLEQFCQMRLFKRFSNTV